MNNEFDNMQNKGADFKQPKKQVYNIAIIVLLVLILIVGVIILLDMNGYSVFNKDNDDDKNNKEQKETIDPSELNKIAELKRIIEEELWILGGKNNINEITNHDKLLMAKKIYCNNHPYYSDTTCYKDKTNTTTLTSFKFDNLNTVYENSSISNLGSLKAENIKCSLGHNEWTYDNQTKTYSYTALGHGGFSIEPAYKKLINFTNNNNEYTISYKYIWTYSTEYIKYPLYSSYDINEENYINDVPMEYVDPIEGVETMTVEEYIESVYKSMEDELDTYNYVFRKTNGKMKLINFYIN